MKFDALFTNSALPVHWAILQVFIITALVVGICLGAIVLMRRIFQAGRGSSSDLEGPVKTDAPGHFSRQTRTSLVIFAVICTNRILIPEVAAFRKVSENTVTALQVCTILSFSWMLMRLARGARMWLDERFDVSMPDNLRSRRVRTQTSFIEKIFDMAVVVITTAVVLGQFESGRKLSTGLLASAGVASLVIGFAAQRTLANLLAGFQIAFTSPIRIDDAVVVEDEWGWIEEISLTYVVVRVWDRRRLILPITYFVEKPFQNWTRKSGQILGSVFLEVAPQTPFEPLNQELNRLLDENRLWDGDARVLQVVEMKERCVQLRALMTARSSPECWDLRCAVRRGLIEFLVREYPDCLPTTRVSVLGAASQISTGDRQAESNRLESEPRPPMDSWIAPSQTGSEKLT